MTNLKTTPGEWRYIRSFDAVVVGDDDYPPVVLLGDPNTEDETRIANLTLAAAAPELFTACKTLLSVYGSEKAPVRLDNALTLASRAIAKATGH